MGGYHIVGLKRDGTVVSAGADTWGENAVGDWTDVIQIQAVSDNNLEQTYGLCSDGRVLIAGGGSDYDSIKRYVSDHYGPGEGQIMEQKCMLYSLQSWYAPRTAASMESEMTVTSSFPRLRNGTALRLQRCAPPPGRPLWG